MHLYVSASVPTVPFALQTIQDVRTRKKIDQRLRCVQVKRQFWVIPEGSCPIPQVSLEPHRGNSRARMICKIHKIIEITSGDKAPSEYIASWLTTGPATVLSCLVDKKNNFLTANRIDMTNITHCTSLALQAEKASRNFRDLKKLTQSPMLVLFLHTHTYINTYTCIYKHAYLNICILIHHGNDTDNYCENVLLVEQVNIVVKDEQSFTMANKSRQYTHKIIMHQFTMVLALFRQKIKN
jgi:hypothetical protein